MSGGNSRVQALVNKFSDPPLDGFFRGLIDLDDGKIQSTDRLKRLARYSFENYYLDPLNVFGLLVDKGLAPPIQNLNITAGDVHILRVAEATVLQAVVNRISADVAPKLTNPDSTRTLVRFCNGIALQYPKWMIEYRGHDLLPAYQAVYGSPKEIHPRNLIQEMRHVRMIPEDLSTVMRELQPQ